VKARSRAGDGTDHGCVSADLLRTVAGHLRAGATLRGALACLYEEAPITARVPLERLSRLLALGQTVVEALRRTRGVFEDGDAQTLISLIAVHERDGGDLAGMLESLADRIDSRDMALRAAQGAGAGALLSARIVAGLPILVLLVTPGIDRSMLHGNGLLLLVTGLGLVAGGAAWMRRLVPRPEAVDDPVAIVCDVAACALRAGSSLHAALNGVLDACPREIRPQFEKAHRLVNVGASWPEALRRSGHADLADLAASIGHAQRLGVPLATSLERWAETRRTRRLRDFEVAVRRAPVLMVLPLTLCMLPAYLILGLGPVLHAS
jgi:tight adherence protein B